MLNIHTIYTEVLTLTFSIYDKHIIAHFWRWWGLLDFRVCQKPMGGPWNMYAECLYIKLSSNWNTRMFEMTHKILYFVLAGSNLSSFWQWYTHPQTVELLECKPIFLSWNRWIWAALPQASTTYTLGFPNSELNQLEISNFGVFRDRGLTVANPKGAGDYHPFTLRSKEPRE